MRTLYEAKIWLILAVTDLVTWGLIYRVIFAKLHINEKQDDKYLFKL